ncbi:MAG: protein kinase, partial [Lysobacterales bacterium]
QTASGLQAAHKKGITHRDIKSANNMITEDGQVKIMDFGLAKLANRSKMPALGTTLGTAAYMSPEQSRGENTDHRADIWSLGVVLYEMISGQMPFKGDYEQAVIYSIQNEDPEPLTAVRTGVPIALDGVIAKALAKERDIRYQNVEELPADLRAIDHASVNKSRISAKAVSGQDLAQTPDFRKALQWKVAVTMMVAAAIVGGFAVWVMLRGGAAAPNPLKKFAITLPANGELSLPGADRDALSSGVAISPDGGLLVYVADDGKNRKLYLRKLEEFNTTALIGTDGAGCPFFSPDGQWVGFYADGKLKKVLLAGGKPIDICEVGTGFGGAAWGIDD